jgi:hypothetical protein
VSNTQKKMRVRNLDQHTSAVILQGLSILSWLEYGYRRPGDKPGGFIENWTQ